LCRAVATAEALVALILGGCKEDFACAELWQRQKH